MNWENYFNKGMTIDQFLKTGTEKERKNYIEIYKRALSLEREVKNQIKSIERTVKILAFAEMWCPDCIANLPALQLMESCTDSIDCRILPREGNEYLLERYKADGKVRIPTFLLFNGKFHEIGVFIEQPSIVKELIKSGTQAQVIAVKRAYRKGEYIHHTIQDIVQLLKIPNFKGNDYRY